MIEQYQPIIDRYARQFAVPVEWIKAVIMTESSGRQHAYRAEPQINDASYGLMQLLHKTARGLGYTGTADGLYDPDTNIRLGTMLLSDLRNRFGQNFDRVYSAYNSGSPTKYTTSTQVKLHVERAREWLQRFHDNPSGERRSSPRVAGPGVVDDKKGIA